MKTTNELIEWLNVESILAKEDNSPIAASRLRDSAQRLRELEQDAARFDWIIENCAIKGGGHGFTLSAFIPVDSEDIRTAIDAAMQSKAVL